MRFGIEFLIKALHRACSLTTIGRIQTPIVCCNMIGLIVAASVDIRVFVVFAVVEFAGTGLLCNNERVTRAERGLIEKIAGIGITEIVAIKVGGSISYGFGYKGIIVAVEKINLLSAEVLRGSMSPAAAFASALAMNALTFRSDVGPFMHEPVARQTGPQYQVIAS